MKSIQPTHKLPTWGKPIPDHVAVRAATNITVDDATGCHVSKYHLNPGGYAIVSTKPKGQKSQLYLAHRAAWTYANGPIPDGYTVDHTCFNKACVNPAHLRLLTNPDNAARRGGHAFPLGECSNGHPAEFREMAKWGKVPAQSYCTACLREKNDRTTALRRLETTYGLTLTKRQQDMVDEFMPQHAQAERLSA